MDVARHTAGTEGGLTSITKLMLSAMRDAATVGLSPIRNGRELDTSERMGFIGDKR